MRSARLELALGGQAPAGRALLLGADDADLGPLARENTVIVERFAPHHDALKGAGWQVVTRADGAFDTVIVSVPRSRAAARARLAEGLSMLAPGGVFWVDGQKTDGIEPLLRELRALGEVGPVHAKAHGKIALWAPEQPVPEGWAASFQEVTPGFVTRPGVFSADGVDPGSALLAAALPDKLPTRIVDLGAGWGWLSAQILTRAGVQKLHLVEADLDALDCARRNINDERASFHWADARGFTLPEPVNGVIMNPPFHIGRSGDPALGAAFIAAAARLLTGAGRLWMVANRHLPYEQTLAAHFRDMSEIGGDSRFKILTASGARSPARK